MTIQDDELKREIENFMTEQDFSFSQRERLRKIIARAEQNSVSLEVCVDALAAVWDSNSTAKECAKIVLEAAGRKWHE